MHFRALSGAVPKEKEILHLHARSRYFRMPGNLGYLNKHVRRAVIHRFSRIHQRVPPGMQAYVYTALFFSRLPAASCERTALLGNSGWVCVYMFADLEKARRWWCNRTAACGERERSSGIALKLPFCKGKHWRQYTQRVRERERCACATLFLTGYCTGALIYFGRSLARARRRRRAVIYIASRDRCS